MTFESPTTALLAATTAGPLPDWLRVAGIVVVAALSATAVLAVSPRLRAVTTLATLLLAPALLLGEIWSSPQVEALRARPALAAGAGAAGLAALAGLAVAFARRPQWFAIAAVAALPFRVPIEAAGATANLLVPLYVVIGAGALAWLVPLMRASAPDEEPDRRSRWLEWLLIGSVVLYALQSAHTEAPSRALAQVVFFYAPFALLFARLRCLEWTPRLLAQCFGVLVALALVFAAIGFVEYQTRHLLLNPKVIASNQIEEYFRVNSLFFDPNIYGRFLVVVMLGVTAVLLWTASSKLILGATAVLVVLAGGLLLTLSQSSFAALLVGLAVLALLRWRARWTLLAVGLAVGVAAVLLLAAPGLVGLDVSDRESLDDASSGRVELIDGGLRLAVLHPVLGAGSGSFEAEYRRLENGSSARATAASHTIPVTVAAEQGVIGLLVYFALLAAALIRLLRGARKAPARAAVAAAFAALAAHTWMYAAYLEDPMTWALLGIGAALAAATGPGSERRGDPERAVGAVGAGTRRAAEASGG